MARYNDAVCRLCRREGMKLFLKGERCFKEKCSFETRKGKIPGQHGGGKTKKPTGYAVQLREKQKVKRIYGVLEKQFRLYFERAERKKGVTGHNLLAILEQRLDNVVYRLGFAPSRAAARQMVMHGHVQVDGRRVDIPRFQTKAGQSIDLIEDIPTVAELCGRLRREYLAACVVPDMAEAARLADAALAARP